MMTNLVNEKRLRKELQEADFFLQRYPENSRRLESVARALYWLGEENARAYLLMVAQAAETGVNYDRMRAATIIDWPVRSKEPTNTSKRLTGILGLSKDKQTP